MNPQRRTILFTGRVQGVGFRLTAVHLAHDLALSGTVRNLADGRVELIAQGSPRDINSLLSRLGEHFGPMIRKVDQASGPADPAAGTQPGIQIVH